MKAAIKRTTKETDRVKRTLTLATWDYFCATKPGAELARDHYANNSQFLTPLGIVNGVDWTNRIQHLTVPRRNKQTNEKKAVNFSSQCKTNLTKCHNFSSSSFFLLFRPLLFIFCCLSLLLFLSSFFFCTRGGVPRTQNWSSICPGFIFLQLGVGQNMVMIHWHASPSARN